MSCSIKEINTHSSSHIYEDLGGSLYEQDSGINSNYYVKLLICNHFAGTIIGNTGQEIKNLKNLTGAKVVLSPHGMYFPGTNERLVGIEGNKSAVLTVIDWIMDKLHQNEKSDFTQAWATNTIVKICVPRAVVGSLIGKNGGYIQSLRVSTGATINISPLFVTADEACAERVVSVESRSKHSLRTAVFTLIRKINSHPDKATCKHVCYFKKLSFESPNAQIGALKKTLADSSHELLSINEARHTCEAQVTTEPVHRFMQIFSVTDDDTMWGNIRSRNENQSIDAIKNAQTTREGVSTVASSISNKDCLFNKLRSESIREGCFASERNGSKINDSKYKYNKIECTKARNIENGMLTDSKLSGIQNLFIAWTMAFCMAIILCILLKIWNQ